MNFLHSKLSRTNAMLSAIEWEQHLWTTFKTTFINDYCHVYRVDRYQEFCSTLLNSLIASEKFKDNKLKFISSRKQYMTACDKKVFGLWRWFCHFPLLLLLLSFATTAPFYCSLWPRSENYDPRSDGRTSASRGFGKTFILGLLELAPQPTKRIFSIVRK